MPTINPAQTRPGSPLSASQIWSKVPEVTLYFWFIKIMATTVGETAADYLNMDLNFGLTVTSLIMAGLLAVVLVFQVGAKRYTPWLYWLAVVLISVVGTLITDNMVDNFGITLVAATMGFSLALAATFVGWYLSEKTLSIHSITTRKRELFYWLAILFTFALGTAAGDLTAEGLHLGYWLSALMFAGIIAAITAAYYFLKLNAVLAFWMAYILTRPLGASMGDYLSQPLANGGLGLGTTGTSLIFLSIILVLVVFLTVTRRDVIAVK
jgi:uncharacterized membrane-anchored protein